MKNKILFPVLIVLWVLSLIFIANYVHKNFDKILIFKNDLKKSYVNANAYKVNIDRVLKLNKKQLMYCMTVRKKISTPLI